MKQSKLSWIIFICMILGIIVGWQLPEIGENMQIFAQIFLNMIKMIIAPLLFSVIVTGIASHGNVKSLGKLGVKTLTYFACATLIALGIGLTVGHIFKPGVGFNISISQGMLDSASLLATQNAHASFTAMLVNIFPTSIVKAMANGDLLQIVVFSIFFSLAICSVGEPAKPVLKVITSLSEIMFTFTRFVMYFAPLGVFGAVAHTIAVNGLGIMTSYAKIIFSLYFALALFAVIILTIVCKIVGISVFSLLRAIREPAILAFSTASSEAALPQAMKIMEKFGVPKNIVGFVMPTGYTFNLDGSTLYLALCVLFSTQILGIDLTISEQIFLMATLLLTSKGIAGVPRVALVVLAGTLSSFGYPLIGVAILLGIDQILDMGRTTINLIGNCVATVLVAKWENEFNYSKMIEFETSYTQTNKPSSILNKFIKKDKEIDYKSVIKIEETSSVGIQDD